MQRPRGDIDDALRYLSQAREPLPRRGLLRSPQGSAPASAGDAEAAGVAIRKAIKFALDRSALVRAQALLKEP